MLGATKTQDIEKVVATVTHHIQEELGSAAERIRVVFRGGNRAKRIFTMAGWGSRIFSN